MSLRLLVLFAIITTLDSFTNQPGIYLHLGFSSAPRWDSVFAKGLSCEKSSTTREAELDDCRLEYAKRNYMEFAPLLFQGDDTRPIILFDGLCNLCNSGVNFALDNDRGGGFRFASLQSVVGRSLLLSLEKDPKDISSIVLVTSNARGYFKSDAVLRISRGLDSPVYRAIGALSLAITPRFVRDTVYGLVSKNRYRLFGASESCRLEDESFGDRFVADPPLKPK